MRCSQKQEFGFFFVMTILIVLTKSLPTAVDRKSPEVENYFIGICDKFRFINVQSNSFSLCFFFFRGSKLLMVVDNCLDFAFVFFFHCAPHIKADRFDYLHHKIYFLCREIEKPNHFRSSKFDCDLY